MMPAGATAPPPKALKHSVRRCGVPAEHRAQAWFAFSGAAAKKAAAGAGAYVRLSSSTDALPDDVVYRTEGDARCAGQAFPSQRLLSSAKGVEALSRMLLAYAGLRPGSYTRGTCTVAATLLLVFGLAREEDAFWTMVALIEDRLMPECGGQVQHGSRLEVRVLAHLLSSKSPSVSAHLAKLRPGTLEALTQGWFLTGFVCVLPFEVACRVWDSMLLEGSKVAHRIAIALLKGCNASITSCQDVDVLRRVVDTRARQLALNPDALLTAAFKGVTSFSGAWLAQVRSTARLELAREPPVLDPFGAPLLANTTTR